MYKCNVVFRNLFLEQGVTTNEAAVSWDYIQNKINSSPIENWGWSWVQRWFLNCFQQNLKVNCKNTTKTFLKFENWLLILEGSNDLILEGSNEISRLSPTNKVQPRGQRLIKVRNLALTLVAHFPPILATNNSPIVHVVLIHPEYLLSCPGCAMEMQKVCRYRSESWGELYWITRNVFFCITREEHY